MNIALDYDDTYTADRGLWDDFIEAALAKKHHVHLVTQRAYPEDNNAELTELSEEISILFCHGKSKKEVAEARGIHIDIWIDDNPGSILHNSRMSPGELAEWRKNHAD